MGRGEQSPVRIVGMATIIATLVIGLAVGLLVFARFVDARDRQKGS
jgi:uncharacterized membrane-anchored protein YhcB (DUF1043 family)